MASAQLNWDEDYTTHILSRNQEHLADELEDLGGKDLAPTPMELVMGGLASCTAITIKMYAQRKNWEFQSIEVRVEQADDNSEYGFHKSIRLSGHSLSEEQIQRLLLISEKCPVNKLINSGAKTHTTFSK